MHGGKGSCPKLCNYCRLGQLVDLFDIRTLFADLKIEDFIKEGKYKHATVLLGKNGMYFDYILSFDPITIKYKLILER